MPGPYTLCTYPGCGALIAITERRCPRHPYPRRDTRAPARERGYDSDWQRLRDWYLHTHPTCELRMQCAGAMAVDVDHKVPLRAGGGRLEVSNLQSLCRRCHRWKTLNIDSTYQTRSVTGTPPAGKSWR